MLPLNWNKLTESEKRAWAVEQIRLAQIKLDKLLKLSRALQSGKNIIREE